MNPKIIAFHLPQFHRIPENDLWWGEGFTEWTNVKKARPLFRSHYQPRIPKDSRYYDLMNPEIQDWQAELAGQHGIYGFCYYHYWFNGKQLLQRPVEQLLERGKPDFPFCLAWANEPWTRAWDGGDKHILMPQTYGDTDEWRQHIRYLIKAFQDPRYIRVRGKPMLLIYRSSTIRVLRPMLETWQEELQQANLPGIHLVSMATAFDPDPRVHLFDAFADFEPMLTLRNLPSKVKNPERWYAKLARLGWALTGRAGKPPRTFDYVSIWRVIMDRRITANHYPGAFADWDNSPRRGLNSSLLLRNFDRKTFAAGINIQLRKARDAEAEFLFFNAWNEWAEGTYLEPDEQRGLFFLQTIKEALTNQGNAI